MLIIPSLPTHGRWAWDKRRNAVAFMINPFSQRVPEYRRLPYPKILIAVFSMHDNTGRHMAVPNESGRIEPETTAPHPPSTARFWHSRTLVDSDRQLRNPNFPRRCPSRARAGAPHPETRGVAFMGTGGGTVFTLRRVRTRLVTLTLQTQLCTSVDQLMVTIR